MHGPKPGRPDGLQWQQKDSLKTLWRPPAAGSPGRQRWGDDVPTTSCKYKCSSWALRATGQPVVGALSPGNHTCTNIGPSKAQNEG